MLTNEIGENIVDLCGKRGPIFGMDFAPYNMIIILQATGIILSSLLLSLLLERLKLPGLMMA